MPAAPPEIAAAWVERIAKGVILGLFVLPFSFCYAVALNSGFIPYNLARGLSDTVLSLVGLVICWLLTSPEPGDPYWLLWQRWISRTGPLAGVAMGIILFVVVLGVPMTPAETTELAVVYALASLYGLAGAAASCWYSSRLGHRLGDAALRISFAILKWIFGVLFVCAVIGAMLTWDKAVENRVTMLTNVRNQTGAHLTGVHLLVWTGISLALLPWFAWLQWRLWRRLRAASKFLRTRGDKPHDEVIHPNNMTLG